MARLLPQLGFTRAPWLVNARLPAFLLPLLHSYVRRPLSNSSAMSCFASFGAGSIRFVTATLTIQTPRVWLRTVATASPLAIPLVIQFASGQAINNHALHLLVQAPFAS